MSWEAVAAVGSAVAAVAAIAAAFIAFFQMKAAKSAAADSETAAQESRHAADRAARAAETSAEAQVKMAELAEAEAARPPWRLIHSRGDTYAAINEGAHTLYRVSAKYGGFGRHGGSTDVLHSGAQVQFMAARAFGSQDEKVTVTWFDSPDGGSEHSWQDELPAKP